MTKKSSIVTINAGATVTLRIKVKRIAGEEEKAISTPSSVRGYSIYLHLLDDAGNRCWSAKLIDSMWDNKNQLYKVELSGKDTLKMSGKTVHFEASMRDSNNHVIISDLIELPDVVLQIIDNSIGRWMENE